MKRSAFLLLFVFLVLSAQAQLRTPAIFTEHMVLQQKSEVPVWGWCWPGSDITVTTSWDNKEVKTKTSNTGAWKAVVSTPAAGGPYTVTLKSSSEEIRFNDVMIGEVWICSGQSNMEWNMNGAIDGKEEFPNANYPKIRLFQVKKMATEEPQVMGEGEWKIAAPDNVRWFSAVGYFFGKKLHQELDVPIGLINTSWGGTPAEVWVPDSLVMGNAALKHAAAAQQIQQWWPSKPGVVFNSMIYPYMPYGIAGAIWYQGESNTAAPLTYKDLMEQLITSWRKGFNKDFPFYYVQIAPYSGYGDVETGTLIREQEVKMLGIPHTGMVVISDHVEDVKDIHPKYKQPVGERLANYALGDLYDKTGFAYKSPLYKSMKVEKGKIRITFDNAENGLISKGGDLAEFLIAGEDRKFVPAKAKIEGNTVVVSAKEVKAPVAVRFGWANGSVPNLFNKEGLPASSFRTDDWPVLK